MTQKLDQDRNNDDRAGQPASAEQLRYAYKPSLMGAPWEFRLDAGGLAWKVGRFEGSVPYAGIRRVRLSFRPATMQSRRFVTEIWTLRRTQAHHRLDHAGAAWPSRRGRTRPMARSSARCTPASPRPARRPRSRPARPSVLYWPGLAVFAVASVALAVLTVRALATGAYAGAAFVGFFFALFLWQSGNYFHRNQPGRYAPRDLPARLVPPG